MDISRELLMSVFVPSRTRSQNKITSRMTVCICMIEAGGVRVILTRSSKINSVFIY